MGSPIAVYFCSFLHIQRPFFKSLCFFVLWGRLLFSPKAQCRLRGGGTRPPNPKPEQTRSPSPNQSLTARGPQSPSPRKSPICFGPESPGPRKSPNCLGPGSPSPREASPISVGPESPMDPRARSKTNRTLCASLTKTIFEEQPKKVR
jgi:hypothetical protein